MSFAPIHEHRKMPVQQVSRFISSSGFFTNYRTHPTERDVPAVGRNLAVTYEPEAIQILCADEDASSLAFYNLEKASETEVTKHNIERKPTLRYWRLFWASTKGRCIKQKTIRKIDETTTTKSQ